MGPEDSFEHDKYTKIVAYSQGECGFRTETAGCGAVGMGFSGQAPARPRSFDSQHRGYGICVLPESEGSRSVTLWMTIFVGVIAFSNLVLLVGLAVLAFSIKRILDRSVKPAISQAESTIASVNSLVDKVEDRAEDILDIGKDTVRQVSSRVVATTDMVQHSVASPIISVSSLLAGISKALETWRSTSAKY